MKIQVNIYIFKFNLFINIERHRRSKHEQQGRVFACNCGKAFLSKPALNNHIKTKHPEMLDGQPKRGRGRPRKYPPKTVLDFESTKYDNFFNTPERKSEEGKTLNIPVLVQNVFDFIYKGNYRDKLFSQPINYQDIPILNNLILDKPINEKPKNEITCDDAFYEYLHIFKDKTNDKYFSLVLKFIILFRECYDNHKNKDNGEQKEAVTNKKTPEELPDLCNEFYGEFMEPNNFFDINDQDERNEIIEIIQHFCIWLFKKEYTKSKLSLASSS